MPLKGFVAFANGFQAGQNLFVAICIIRGEDPCYVFGVFRLTGTKLLLENKVSSYSIGDEDFLVLVPFAKKDRLKSEHSATSPAMSEFATSKQSESTWCDVVDDLSVLCSEINSKDQNDVENETISLGTNIHSNNGNFTLNNSSQRKRKLKSQVIKTYGPTDELIFDILQSFSSSIVEQTSKFVMVLDSVNCLSDPNSGNCICIEAQTPNNEMDPRSGKNKFCLCPSWLKSKLKLFSFINVYYAVTQLQHGQVTMYSLKRALDEIAKFGFQASITDVEYLSDLCTKLIRIVDNYDATITCTNAIVIIKSSSEQGEQHDVAKKCIPESKIISSMKRRQECFNTSLLKALRSLMLEDRSKFSSFSLEDFILHVKQCSDVSNGNKVKPSDSHSFKALCHDTNPMHPIEILDHLRKSIGSKGQIVHVEQINARNATFVEIPHELSECTQAESIQASLAGKDVVVATLTSSGKSLCYNLPVLEVLSYNSLACALYLFPTKALAQDQLRALLSMANEFDLNQNIGVYDGDTSQSDRIWLRENARVLITNPDMLHMSILPFHGQFSRILSNLRFVILDEAHAYKGAFGCHVALILRRLRRLCSHVYGSNPSFVFSTATSANPADHTKVELANLPAVELIQNDGSPSGPKTFVLWNPPVTKKCKGTNAMNSTDRNRSVVAGRSSKELTNELEFIILKKICYENCHACPFLSADESTSFKERVTLKSCEVAVLLRLAKDLDDLITLYSKDLYGDYEGLRDDNEDLDDLIILNFEDLSIGHYEYPENEDEVVIHNCEDAEFGFVDVDNVIVLEFKEMEGEAANLEDEMVQDSKDPDGAKKFHHACTLKIREILKESAPHLVDAIGAYRGGYVAEDRRRIEQKIFQGKMCGIAATNALELGIDVGHIDVTLHLGFPGSIASLWQQAGRSGRRGNPSIAIYVAFGGPLDQYFMKLPTKLFRSPVECCHIDANNPQVLEQHVACAAFEHPLSLHHDEKYFGPGLESAVMTLKNKGYLNTDMSRNVSARIWSYIGPEKIPSNIVNVRAIEIERYQVIDKQKNEVLEEIEESRAFFQVYEGAVYMNQGKTYLVKDMDLSSKIAWCQEADLKYYTKTRDYTDIHIVGGNISYPPRNSNIQFARTTAQAQFCRVTTTWFGFRRIWKKSNQVFDTIELSLPNYSYESQAVWVPVPAAIKKTVDALSYSFRGGLHAACHAVLNVVPLFIICNASDIASECANPYDARCVPDRILLYDPRPGGTGIAAQVQPVFTELLTSALELLTSCHCSGDAGCPNCIQRLPVGGWFGEYGEDRSRKMFGFRTRETHSWKQTEAPAYLRNATMDSLMAGPGLGWDSECVRDILSELGDP
ncbi:hypothetical protein DM860_008833 [Cuscuta australis]|uniref:Uncharacterized protein n=1 Tax=Cuscuta australis TaxID=267555 RepID=A0A328DBG7_9ASTE|nr:hypothetical protein DM860_008833 [Cuscuta australis]